MLTNPRGKIKICMTKGYTYRGKTTLQSRSIKCSMLYVYIYIYYIILGGNMIMTDL